MPNASQAPIVTFKPVGCVYCERGYNRWKALAAHLEKKHDVPPGSAAKIARAFYLHALG